MRKICVVGGGRWGRNHIRTLRELDMLGGICEVDPDSRTALAAAFPETKCFDTLEAALNGGFDGFTVATPAQTHFAIAETIMRSGYPVLVEKPLALTAAEARRLLEVSNETGMQLMVGHLMLFHPAIEKIKSMLDEGRLGSVRYIYSNRLNLGTVRTEENVLWSFSPHDISIFQYLLGAGPTEVVSRGGAFLQSTVHDSTMTILRYPGNVLCHNYVSWLHPFKEHRIVIVGSKGMLRFEDGPDAKTLTFYDKGIEWVDGEPLKREGSAEVVEFGDEQPLTEELRYFAENLDGSIDRADAKSAIEVLEVLETASAQLDGVSTQAGTHTGGAAYAEGVRVHESAFVDEGCSIGAGTSIWHFSHVQSNASIGSDCTLGQNVNVGPNVKIGNGVRIQNNVSVFEGVELEDNVFCGPSMTFTNVLVPRAKYPTGRDAYGRTLVRNGASIGAKAVIVCGNEIGRHAFVAAGAVVTQSVPDYAFMVGTPARQVGWMTEGGQRVAADFEGVVECEVSGKRYRVDATEMVELD